MTHPGEISEAETRETACINTEAPSPRVLRWRRLDAAAFGLIYGGITALALLMKMSAHPDTVLSSAFALFGSVLAIVLAKAFAEVMSDAIETQTRITRARFRRAWDHAKTTLIAANLPTLLFLAAGLGLFSPASAIALSQLYCVTLLALVGARVGWRLDAAVSSALLGAMFSGGVGLALALSKYVIQ